MQEGRPPHIDCCRGRRARSVITTTHWFRMPLSKVKDLTNILIDHGYIILLRTYRRHAVFCERLELLVMSALYLLGLGAAFCSCKPLCGISTSGVQKFFYTFIEALVDMKDEYIRLPWNLTDLKCVNKDYNATELSGCSGPMDVVHVKWSHCLTGNHNRAKRKKGYPTLGFQCITDFNWRVMAIYGPQFGSQMDKDIVKHDDTSEAGPCPLQPCYFAKWDIFAYTSDCQYVMGFPLCILNNFLPRSYFMSSSHV